MSPYDWEIVNITKLIRNTKAISDPYTLYIQFVEISWKLIFESKLEDFLI